MHAQILLQNSYWFSSYLCSMKKENFIEKLDASYEYIKNKAKTGIDLYNAFRDYKDLVIENWPEDMPDNGNWFTEMQSVLSFIENKKDVVYISNSVPLMSFRDDALEAIHAINMKFKMYSRKS